MSGRSVRAPAAEPGRAHFATTESLNSTLQKHRIAAPLRRTKVTLARSEPDRVGWRSSAPIDAVRECSGRNNALLDLGAACVERLRNSSVGVLNRD